MGLAKPDNVEPVLLCVPLVVVSVNLWCCTLRTEPFEYLSVYEGLLYRRTSFYVVFFVLVVAKETLSSVSIGSSTLIY